MTDIVQEATRQGIESFMATTGRLPPNFALLAEHAKRLGLAGLSMGMSSDYETAALLGSTVVRVGSALFGSR